MSLLLSDMLTLGNMLNVILFIFYVQQNKFIKLTKKDSY